MDVAREAREDDDMLEEREDEDKKNDPRMEVGEGDGEGSASSGVLDDVIDNVARGGGELKKEKSRRETSEEADEAGKPHVLREQDRYLPICNIARVMRRMIPESGKMSKEAKECIQESVSEFISFVTSEASDKCIEEKRKTITADDLINAMENTGLERYVEPLRIFLKRHREATRSPSIRDDHAVINFPSSSSSSSSSPFASSSSTTNGSATRPPAGVPTQSVRIPLPTGTSAANGQGGMVYVKHKDGKLEAVPNLHMPSSSTSIGHHPHHPHATHADAHTGSHILHAATRHIQSEAGSGGAGEEEDEDNDEEEEEEETAGTGDDPMALSSMVAVSTPSSLDALQPVPIFLDPTSGQHYISVASDDSGMPRYMPVDVSGMPMQIQASALAGMQMGYGQEEGVEEEEDEQDGEEEEEMPGPSRAVHGRAVRSSRAQHTTAPPPTKRRRPGK